jgi:branched-chain amino acid transport system substrate-binding protein
MPVVRLGLLAPLDAGLVDFGRGIRNSVQVAVDQANKRNTIPGWKIELVAANDSSDPGTGAVAVAKLASDPSIIGVVGPYNSGVAQAALPVMAAAHLALISPSNTLSSLTLGTDPATPARPYSNYFRMVASDAQQAPFLARSIRKLGMRRVAVVSETKAVSKGLADAFATAFTDGGGHVTTRQVVADGTTDFSTFVKGGLTDKPDAIFFGGEYLVAASLRDQATAVGYTKPLVGGDGIKDPSYIKDAGAAGQGTLASTVGAPATTLPSAKGFLAAYKPARFSEPPTDYGPYAYDAANLLIAAARSAVAGRSSLPTNAREMVVAAVQNSHGKGVSGPLGFDAFGDTTNRVFTLYRVQKTTRGRDWVPFKP